MLIGGPEARQSFNSREKDQEAGLFNNGVRKLEDDDGRFTSIDPLWEKFPAWSPYQHGYNNPLAVTDPSGMQGVPIDDEDEVDPYWEGGGGAGGAGGGGSMSAREFFTRAWNAIFSTTKSTPGGAGASPAATPNRSENPDLLPAASSKPTAIPENYPGTRSSSSARATATSSAPKGGTNVIPEGKLANHIFSGKAGKLLDTPANRSLITDLTNNSKNLLGVDQYGKSWYARTLDDGTQLYGYTQGGVVKGAGINQTPLNIIENQGLK